MAKSKPISFAEFRDFLNGLGFKSNQVDTGWLFQHPTEGPLVFRAYAEGEAVAERDLRSTRKFLDWRGVLAAEEFDAFVQRATPA